MAYNYCEKCSGMWCGTGGCLANDPAWIMEKEPERYAYEFPHLVNEAIRQGWLDPVYQNNYSQIKE